LPLRIVSLVMRFTLTTGPNFRDHRYLPHGADNLN